MFCPACLQPNPADAARCAHCQHDTGYFRERVFIGRQFIFAQADDRHPIALKVDDGVQVFHAPAILSRHQHAIGFGDTPDESARSREYWPLPDQARLAPPDLQFLTVVTDRKIYKPTTDASIFIIAPDAANAEASIEIKLGNQKVYEAKEALNRNGLALHRYADLKEGEYVVEVAVPGRQPARTDCAFSVAEFALSPLIATLDDHRFEGRHLSFTLKLLLLSAPYSGPVELGLQCKVCGERVVATQKVKAQDGVAQGDFDISSHGGPFHVQITTPGGHTALVAFPGTGAQEREHIVIDPLGQTIEMGLLPWAGAEPVRGFYLGAGEMNMTPLMLDSAHAAIGRLRSASDLPAMQMVIFNPRRGEQRVIDRAALKRGEAIEFEVDAPYSLFTVGTLHRDQPFEGWGVVVKPIAFEATLHAPDTARPGETIDVEIDLAPDRQSAFCWLLVYDARLEHESPLPRLAKRIYESVRGASSSLQAAEVKGAKDGQVGGYDFMVKGTPVGVPPMPATMPQRAVRAVAAAGGPQLFSMRRAEVVAEAETPTMVVAPTRMEFPELVYDELFFMEGHAARTVPLGDQIGTWRVRAYVIDSVDVRELTADVPASKPLYAELDLPALASTGDDISASINYTTREPAELIIATPWGETHRRVSGSGQETIAVKGPGRVEARIASATAADWTVRDIAPPGVQKVTASRLMILDTGQTARGEKVVVYASVGQVLKDTIAALINYPFG